MILSVGSSVVIAGRRRCYSSINSTVCLSSSSSSSSSSSATIPSEQIRNELDNLHKEALDTTAKANNSRLRLMRLSEAAEKLRNQAAVSVRTGRDNDARELLFQKKKVMQAMEKLKTRIELFDELSSKLTKAISTKETLLIDNVSSDAEVTDQTKTPTPVRIVSPKGENQDNRSEDLSKPIRTETEGDEESQDFGEPQWKANEEVDGNAKEISTYKRFVGHLDQQLNRVEVELETFIRFSNLSTKRNAVEAEYDRVRHLTGILEDIHHTRERLASILQSGWD